ncbi:MAG TPA: FecR family protein [Terriglobales bacterium]|jgi:hypothetical protein
MKRHLRFSRLVLVAFVVTVISDAAFADSHARIVRLSSVEGQVQIDRATGQGLERAILNTPVVEGTRIVTGADGLAEIEFENQSALRITENSEIKFTQLLMNDAGTKTNRITVEKGLVYLDTASKGDDSYLITVDDRSLTAGRDTLMRISATPDQLQVAVFKGEVQFQGQGEPTIVHKKETLTLDLKTASQLVVAKGVEPDQFDNWNKEREDYSKTYADNKGYGGPSRAYGLQDLNYYGDFFYAPGFGNVWQPYGFAGSMVNWNPYMNGAWMFYPGMGYSWASAYPWGWLPFHYGSWAFINGAGWAWVPGRYSGQWYTNAYQIVPRVTKAPTGWTAPAPPATTAAATSSPTVVVGKAGTTPLSIPGGRIPPNFASLVPGRAVAPTSAHGFVHPNTSTAAANHTVFASPRNGVAAAHPGTNGHVFAQPARGAVFADEGMMHSGYGGSRATSMPAGSMHSGAGAGSVHSSGSSASSAAHK